MVVVILLLSSALQVAAIVIGWQVLRGVPNRLGRGLTFAVLLLFLARRVSTLATVLGGTSSLVLADAIATLLAPCLSIAAMIGLGRILAGRWTAEEALRHSERRLQIALEGGGYGVWEFGTDGKLWTDERLRQLFDVDPSLVDPDEPQFYAHIHPEDRERTALSSQTADSAGRFETEYRVIDRKGNIRWLRSIGRVLSPAKPGGVPRTVGITRDVSQRMRTELALRESEERYRLLADNADDMISLHDLRGRMLYVSPSAQRMTGFGLEDLLGRMAYTLVHPEDRAAVRRAARRAVLRRTSALIEWRRLRHDGTYSWSETSARVLMNPQGRPERLLCVTRDVSARRQSEEALRHSEREYRTIVETAQEGIWLFDHEGKTQFANQRMAELLGGSVEEVLKSSLSDFVSDVDRLADVRRVLERKDGPHEPFELTLRRKDGREVVALVSSSPIEGAPGLPDRTLAMIVDITRRKEHERDLQASLSAQETLLKEIHHRVKNNLAVVVHLLMLQRGQTDDAASEAILRECQDRVHTMSLIHESLYRSGGEATLAISPFCSRLCDYLFQSHAIDRQRVRMEVVTDNFRIDLDLATPLGLLLNELVSNAFKHAYPGRRTGVVRVELTRLWEDQARLMVADDGIGLHADIDVASANSLGLKLVRTLARQLDAELDVKRDSGSAFVLTFPLHERTVKKDE